MGEHTARVVNAARDDDPDAMTRAWAAAQAAFQADPADQDAASALALVAAIDDETELGASLPDAIDAINPPE